VEDGFCRYVEIGLDTTEYTYCLLECAIEQLKARLLHTGKRLLTHLLHTSNWLLARLLQFQQAAGFTSLHDQLRVYKNKDTPEEAKTLGLSEGAQR
jgi:hypothetical protein